MRRCMKACQMIAAGCMCIAGQLRQTAEQSDDRKMGSQRML